MRKMKLFSVLVLLALLLSASPTVTAQKQDSKIARVHFAPATELSTAMKEMERYGVRLLAFQRAYKIGGQTVVDGYFLKPDDQDQADASALEGRYWRSHGAMLQDLAQDINLNQRDFVDAEAQAVWQRRADAVIQAQEKFTSLERCWITGTCPTVDVVTMLVSGDAVALSEVARSSLVTRVEIQGETTRNSRSDTDNTRGLMPQTLVSSSTWMPSQGDVHVHPSSYAGERYVTNWMKWNDVAGFGSNSTYEHDFFLNDSDNSKYGPGTYLSDAETWNGIPNVSYWSTSLPRPYLDTRTTDPDYLKSYTVGCSDGDALAADVWYYTYVRAANGDAEIDNGFLQGELGHREPSWCYESTWCVQGDNHVNIYPPYDIDPIPGDFYWTYP